jgi:hypothetical protein
MLPEVMRPATVRASFAIAVAAFVAMLPVVAFAGSVYRVVDLSAGDPADGGGANGVDAGRVVGSRRIGGFGHATVWPGFAAAPVDLNPAGVAESAAVTTSGGRQVGFASSDGSVEKVHATLWSGTAASAVDLHPAGFDVSLANGISGSQQVGYGLHMDTGWAEALLWSGTAAGVVSLHPAGALSSDANAVWNGRQVGSVLLPDLNSRLHATLWSGAAAGAVDLNPAGYDFSAGYGIAEGQQVGIGTLTGSQDVHALLWSGTAASFVDLHPLGAASSSAVATNGVNQVGYVIAAPGGPEHATVWSASAGTAIDLHALLPAGQFSQSEARGIDAEGNIVGVAFTTDGPQAHAIVWRVVPEPGGVVVFTTVALPALLRRRREQ